MKTFENLRNGNVIENPDDGQMTVMFYDFYGDGKAIMCFADGKSIYPAFQFYPADWSLKL